MIQRFWWRLRHGWMRKGAPPPPGEPEIIVRFMHSLCSDPDIAGDKLCIAEFEPVLLANRQGFQYLADYFANLARQADLPEPAAEDPDPDDHCHLDGWPLNEELSDSIQFRIGQLSKANREAVFERYGIGPIPLEDRDLPTRLRELADSAERSQELERERDRRWRKEEGIED